MTRRTMIQRLRDALRRRKRAQKRPIEGERTTISVAVFKRPREVVHPERDLSEWVHKVAERDWDSVVRGTNDR